MFLPRSGMSTEGFRKWLDHRNFHQIYGSDSAQNVVLKQKEV